MGQERGNPTPVQRGQSLSSIWLKEPYKNRYNKCNHAMSEVDRALFQRVVSLQYI